MIRKLCVVLLLSLLITILPVNSLAETTTPTTSAIIPYMSTGYKYKVVNQGEGAGFEKPGFDDSGFSTGDAGFGSLASDSAINSKTYVKTDWPLNTDILVRRMFTLPAETRNLRVGVAIDNDVQVFINGQDISGGLRTHEGSASRDSFVFNAPDGILIAGANLIAVRGRDRGRWDYLDIQVTVETSTSVKIIASDAAAGDYFGYSVAISGDTAVVGATGKADTAGAVYVFIRSGTTWSQQAKLTASDANVSSDADIEEFFGCSVAISNDTIIVGASGEDTEKGAAYIFTSNGITWSQQAKLTASDGKGTTSQLGQGDLFGVSVAVSGDVVVVGAESTGDRVGAAYIFVRSGSTWSQQTKITASDVTEGDIFGSSAAISGNTVVLGADGETDRAGAAYVFTRSSAAWSQQAKLTASDAAPGDAFACVALTSDTIIVGAYGKAGNTGSTYVFTRSGTAWSQQAKLVASDTIDGDCFGVSTAIVGDTAWVGANGAFNNTGAVYIFTRSGTTWSRQDKLNPGDAVAGGNFGWSASLDNDTAIVGMPCLQSQNTSPGAAYIFWYPITPKVNTSAATSVASDSATLNCTLTDLGTATNVGLSFEYGLTDSYVSTSTVVSREAAGAFSTSITGLSPGMTYHFRAKADGGIRGSTTGTDMTFTTGRLIYNLYVADRHIYIADNYFAIANVDIADHIAVTNNYFAIAN